MQKLHIANSDKPVAIYNLDVVISVGKQVYRTSRSAPTQGQGIAAGHGSQSQKGITAITDLETITAPAQIRENALAVARLAEEQMRMMTRLDKAAIVIGQYGKRITALETQLSPRDAVTDEQTADISAKVLAIAAEITELNQVRITIKASSQNFIAVLE